MQEIVTHKTIWLFLAMILAVFWTLAVSPAAAQGPGAGPLLEKPQPTSETAGARREEGRGAHHLRPLDQRQLYPHRGAPCQRAGARGPVFLHGKFQPQLADT